MDPSKYEAVLLGYGLCSNGLVGLTARTSGWSFLAPTIASRFSWAARTIPRLFPKSSGRVLQTSGWIERGEGLTQYHLDSIHYQTGMTQTYEELLAKYGEDNAKFLYEQLCNMTRNYTGMAYITMGIEPDDRFERRAQEEAAHGAGSSRRLPAT